jgi:hypothetical protein
MTTRQTTQLATTQHGTAPGWNRYRDANGVVQYEPAGAPVQRHYEPPAMPYAVDVGARQTVIEDASTELERSTAFVRFTIPLSVAMGGTTLLFAVLGGAGALLAGALAFVGFAGVWLAALVYYVSRSPAGTARHDSNETWKLLRREQQFRHEAYWAHWERMNGGDNGG